MRIASIKIVSEFDNYEEFLESIKMGKNVIRKSTSCCGNFFDELKYKYDSENDCFYFIYPDSYGSYGLDGKKSILPFKTTKDFEKETGNNNIIGLNHKETFADKYPLSDFYMVEFSKGK